MQLQFLFLALCWTISLFNFTVHANLYHIPGVSRNSDPAKNDPNAELYFVCSLGEDDEREDVLEHIDDGADVNAVDPTEGTTCLFSAVMRGKLQVVETVLEYNADLSIPRRSDGLLPLQAAARYGRTHILRLFQRRNLLEKNSNVIVNGVPLLHEACAGFSAHHVNVLFFLTQEMGMDINQKDWLGRTCLDKATEKKLMYHVQDLGGQHGLRSQN